MPHYSPDTHEIMQMVLEDIETHPESNLQMVTDRLEENITLLNPYFTKKGIFYGCIHALSDAELIIPREVAPRIREKDTWRLTETGYEALDNHQTLIDLAQEPLKIKYIFFTHINQNEIENLTVLYLKFYGTPKKQSLIADFIDTFMFGTKNCLQGIAQVGRGVQSLRIRGHATPTGVPLTLTQDGRNYLNSLDSPYEFGPFKIHFNHDNSQYQVETFIPNVHQFEAVIPPVPDLPPVQEDYSEEGSQCNLEADKTTPTHDDFTLTNFHRRPDAINIG